MIAVSLNHLAQLTPLGKGGGPWALGSVGRAGVLVFFVHTALVLMGSLERLEAKGGDTHLIRAFYVQRFFRLYPLSVTCITVILLVHLAVPSFRLGWVTFATIASNLALVQNLTWQPSLIGPLWSLPYEVQMYLVLPFIFFLTKRRGALLYMCVLWVAAAVLGSYLYAADPRYQPTEYQYPWPWFVPTFLGGVIAFILMRKRGANLPAGLWPVLIVGIFVVVQMFPISRPELVMTLLGFAIPQFAENPNRAMRMVAHNVAKYSYGVYLIHFPLIEVCFRRLHSLGVVVKCGLFFSLLVICSVAAYHLIEKPMIDVGHRISRRIATKRKRSEVLVQV